LSNIDKITSIIDEYPISYNKGRNFLYDFLINDSIVLELHGDYWHANPETYLADQIIKYPGNLFMTAQEKWDKDMIKENIAIENGFKYICIWEKDIRQTKDLTNLLLTKLNLL